MDASASLTGTALPDCLRLRPAGAFPSFLSSGDVEFALAPHLQLPLFSVTFWPLEDKWLIYHKHSGLRGNIAPVNFPSPLFSITFWAVPSFCHVYAVVHPRF
jgi:hypothetical protein